MNLRNVSKGRTGPFRGFTLVELIVVITILAILATIGFLALSGYSQDAKDSAIKANVRSVQTAISSEAALTNNSPRYYVVHDTGAALSGAVAYVDGNPTALTGGDWNVSGTNYSAGNPDYAKLKMNPEKFRVSASGLPGGTLGVLARATGFVPAEAAYDARYLTVGAVDALAASTSNGKARSVSYFQVAGISPATWAVTVSGNYPSSSGSVSGLVKDPKASSSTGALVDGAVSGMAPPPIPGTCGAASKAYAFSASTFGTDAFCSAGTASPLSPAFPAAGSSVSWTCSALNGGNVPTCVATRAAAANCSASTQTVNGHSYALSAFNNGNALAGTSAPFAVTWGNQTYSQTFLCTDGTVSTSGAETAGAVTCTAANYALSGGACVPNTCNAIKTAYPTSTDGTYSIDPDGTWTNAAFNAYCDMTSGGGGWTMVYTSSSTIHLSTELLTAQSGTYGVDGYRAAGNVKTIPFGEILYVNHDSGIKYAMARNDAVKKSVNTYGIPYHEDQSVTWKITSPTGSTLPWYDFNLMICDGVWMQTGFMFTWVYNTTWKQCGSWEGDTSTWYFRHDGDYSPNQNAYHGVAFAQNGHGNVTNKLVSVGIR